MIGICTDSNSQLPDDLEERYGVEVVPVTVTVDDVEYLERTDLDADGFYRFFDDGGAPVVTTSQPSPGQFAVAYDRLVQRGCTEILSIHVSGGVSGTLNAARLATKALDVPIRLVDTQTASFGVSCCVWAAADAIAAGASLEQAAALAEALAPSIGNVFVVGALDLVRRGGRAGDLDALQTAAAQPQVPILSLIDGQVQVVERVSTMVDAVNAMALRAIRWADRVNVAIGVADQATYPLGDALADAVGESANVAEVVRYRVGPSVGVHTGPGTVGCFMFPAEPHRPPELS